MKLTLRDGITRLLKDRAVTGPQGSPVSESMLPFKRPCSEIKC